ncbi:MAG: aminoacyl-tRNA hydrolase [Candidatus Heimdallarchaeota archaeon]
MSHILKIIDDWAILGRPGFAGKQKIQKRKELLDKFGESNWKIAYLYEDNLLSREEALIHFENSYQKFFEDNPEILEWLLQTATDIYDNQESNVNSGLDYSIQETEDAHLHDIAIRRVLQKMGKAFQGESLLQIRGENSDGFILSTGQVPFYEPKLIQRKQLKGWWGKNSIESYWQSNKVLSVKTKRLEQLSNKMLGVVLRKDIHMGKGKFSAQAAHAVVSLIPQTNIQWDFDEQPIEIWTVRGEENLVGIYSKAQKMNVNCTLIRDAGKTQIAPGSKTAVGLGPINEAIFDILMNDFDAKSTVTYSRNYNTFVNLTLTSID